MAVPNLEAEKKGRDERVFYGRLLDAPSTARQDAIDSGKTVTMAFDDSQNAVTLTEAADDGTDGDTPFVTVPLPKTLHASSFQLSGNDSSSAEWKLHFYPDGKSDGGGIEIGSTGGDSKSLSVAASGLATIATGPIPDTSQDQWQAGDYEHRQ